MRPARRRRGHPVGSQTVIFEGGQTTDVATLQEACSRALEIGFGRYYLPVTPDQGSAHLRTTREGLELIARLRG